MISYVSENSHTGRVFILRDASVAENLNKGERIREKKLPSGTRECPPACEAIQENWRVVQPASVEMVKPVLSI